MAYSKNVEELRFEMMKLLRKFGREQVTFSLFDIIEKPVLFKRRKITDDGRWQK